MAGPLGEMFDHGIGESPGNQSSTGIAHQLPVRVVRVQQGIKLADRVGVASALDRIRSRIPA